MSVPFRRESDNPGASDTLIVWGTIVVGAIFAVAWMVKRGAGKRRNGGLLSMFKFVQGARNIEIRARVQLTPHTSLHVVHWHGEEILLGCSTQAITVLGRQPLPADGGLGSDCVVTVTGDRQNKNNE